jgi:hypothetical protein
MLGEDQELDWEMIFFNRVSIHKQPKKVKVEEPKPMPKPQVVSSPKPSSSPEPADNSDQPFLRKHLDLILIFGGIILLLFILSIL